MSKSFKDKKYSKKSSNNYFDDGYHSKQQGKADQSRKKMKQFENALRSRNLDKILVYEDQL